MVGAKHVSGKNIYWSTCIGKSKERKIFDFLHCPFEPPAKQHRPVSQLGWILWCMLARPSKGQCTNSKIFPPLLLTVKVDQNIFFPETCFAYTISEQKFTVWSCMEKWPRSILFMKLKWTKPKLIQGDCKLTWEANGLGLLVEFHDRIKNV